MSDIENDPFVKDGDTTTEQTQPDIQKAPKAPATPEPVRKVFTRADVKRHLTVKVHLPKLYPGYDPFEFDLRIKLSKEAEERRQEYLSLAPGAMTVKLPEQALDEICDLLVAAPRGFGDLADNGVSPASSFRAYVESSDPATKHSLLLIVEGADNLYWSMISPREFLG